MLTSSLVILALSAFSTALPTTLEKKDTACSTPKSFTISRFSKFTPAASNPHPAQLSFSYGDDGATVSQTSCLLTGATSTSSTPVACANPDVSFLFENNQLTIFENYTPCDSTTKAKVQGTIYVATYCYPSPPQVPLGEGTTCQTPSTSLGGSLAAA
ncbi:hypothetical protein ONS95_008238 [Cadophora gregata]|uniref:uncharacterized protein n=1 Tax=Cadophora gregata TaxID=51156 RepID=UPI0026DB1364|nr:uncharacterized protein ONS95_008238 [Cadophora gregata]KAK0100279.1 hypothetical protein ONS96_007561 [Cadophora gregata f. sp. sojae]KAK0126655.1 hypothetical protein ONS95_008238 [Cadophora gregata]